MITAGLILLSALTLTGQSQKPLPRRSNAIVVLGVHANAWNAAVVGVNGTSTGLDTQWAPWCSAFGNANGATTIALQLSANNTNWYTSNENQVLAAAGDFGYNFSPGARYVRLTSTAAATITATLSCKGQ